MHLVWSIGIFAFLIGIPSARASEAGPPALAYLSEGAPLYAMLRPAGLVEFLQRLGAGSSAPISQLRSSLGVDPLDPKLLDQTGLSASEPMVLALFEPLHGGRYYHHRFASQITDKTKFLLFLSIVAQAKELGLTLAPPGSPLSRYGVLATLIPPPDAGEKMTAQDRTVAVVRLAGESDAPWLIVDIATPWQGSVPTPLELAARTPATPKAPFKVNDTSSRRMLGGATSLALYLDGRQLDALMGPWLFLANLALDKSGKLNKNDKLQQRQARRAAPQCQALWSKVPGIFDDLLIAAEVKPNGLGVQFTWGRAHAKPPATKFTLAAVDDAALDVETMARFGLGTLSLRLPSLDPVRHLPRSGPLRNEDTLKASFERCAAASGLAIAVRHWPQAIGALLEPLGGQVGGATGKKDSLLGGLADAGQLLGYLRNVHLLVRAYSPSEKRYALAITVASAAGVVLEPLLALLGGAETVHYGKHRPAIYDLSNIASGIFGASGAGGESDKTMSGGVIAFERMPGGEFLFVYADARATLDWAYASTPKPLENPAILSLRADGRRVAQVLRDDPAWSSAAASWADLLVRLGRIEANLSSEPELFRLRIDSSAAGKPQNNP